MIEKKHYNNSKEFEELEKKYHKLGFRMIHNDFIDENGNSTDGNSGILTFSNDIEIQDDSYLFEKELLQKLDTKEINLDGIKELLKIKFGQESYIPPKTLLEKLKFWS